MFYLIIIRGGLIDEFTPIPTKKAAIRALNEKLPGLDENEDAAVYNQHGTLIANAKMLED